MKFENPFYKQCKAGVYSAPYKKTTQPRTPDDIQWLYGKIAYVSATASSPLSGTAGLDTANWKEKNFDASGMYQKITPKSSDPDSDSFDDPIYIPKPHVTAFKTYSDPENLGAIRRCQLTFKVYDRGQLGSMQPFFTPGADLKVTFGWNSSPRKVSDSFVGKIFNFSYSLSSDGGFECSCDAIAKGPNSAINSNVFQFLEDVYVQPITDELGNTKYANNIFSTLDLLRDTLIKNAATPGQIQSIKSLNAVLVKLPENSNETNSGTDAEAETPPNVYVSFKSIVDMLNKLLYSISTNGVSERVQFKFPDTGEHKIIVGSYAGSKLKAADPYQIIFPSSGGTKYDTYEWVGASSQINVYESDRLNPEHMLINIDDVIDFARNVLPTQDSAEKKLNFKIGDFMQRIFDLIKRATGNRAALTLAKSSNLDDPNIYIVDQNTITTKVTPLTIETITNGAVARNVSLTADVPADVAKIFYTLNNAPADLASADIPALASFFGLSTAVKAPDASKITEAEKIINSDPENGPNAMVTWNQQLIGYSLYSGNPKRAALMPLGLVITIDGTPGFEFGDVITTNYLPPIYKKDTIAFIVTEITHDVSNGDWTTTLTTQCKILP